MLVSKWHGSVGLLHAHSLKFTCRQKQNLIWFCCCRWLERLLAAWLTAQTWQHLHVDSLLEVKSVVDTDTHLSYFSLARSRSLCSLRSHLTSFCLFLPSERYQLFGLCFHRFVDACAERLLQVTCKFSDKSDKSLISRSFRLPSLSAYDLHLYTYF